MVLTMLIMVSSKLIMVSSRLIMVSRTNLNPGGSLLKLLPLLLIVQGILGRGWSLVESQGIFDNIKVLKVSKYYILVHSAHCNIRVLKELKYYSLVHSTHCNIRVLKELKYYILVHSAH